jgi:DNA-directed RNA polymerase subunit beta'
MSTSEEAPDRFTDSASKRISLLTTSPSRSPRRTRSGPGRGEVKNPETINYRTFKPEPGGLFCQRIFGPVRDYECACGKYKRIKYKGVSATVAASRSRSRGCAASAWATSNWPCRFPHLVPQEHAEPLGLLLDMTARNLERVIYYENYIVVDPGALPSRRSSS